MIESVEVTKDYILTDEQKQALRAAKKLPLSYDDDSPEFTEEMLDRLLAASKKMTMQKGA